MITSKELLLQTSYFPRHHGLAKIWMYYWMRLKWMKYITQTETASVDGQLMQSLYGNPDCYECIQPHGNSTWYEKQLSHLQWDMKVVHGTAPLWFLPTKKISIIDMQSRVNTNSFLSEDDKLIHWTPTVTSNISSSHYKTDDMYNKSRQRWW